MAPRLAWTSTDATQIYLVSCLYHHISIHYLTTGVMPDQTPAEQDWCSPCLERTEWYDLLDQEQRVDAFRYIWGVMEYLNRDTTAKSSDGASTSGGAQTDATTKGPSEDGTGESTPTFATRKRTKEGEQI